MHFEDSDFYHQVNDFDHVNLEIEQELTFTQEFNICEVFVALLRKYDDVILLRHKSWLMMVIGEGEYIGIQQVAFTVEFVFEYLDGVSV